MSRPTATYIKDSKCMHIEANGCIVNVRQELMDRKGRLVTSIEIIPDDHHVGERMWKLFGLRNNRVIQLKKKLKSCHTHN